MKLPAGLTHKVMRAHKKSAQTSERKAACAPVGTSGFPRPITLFTRVTKKLCFTAMEDVKRQSGLYGSGSSAQARTSSS